MTPQEAYNKLNTAIELINEVCEAIPDRHAKGCWDMTYFGDTAWMLEEFRDSIELPRQDAQVTLDSVKGGSESGQI